MTYNTFGDQATFFILTGTHSFIEVLNPRIVVDEMELVAAEAHQFKILLESMIEEITNEEEEDSSL